ncbi:MAG: 2-oxoacid:acceptor oxidoreductase subunit alpha, partial [Gemmatimonadetes bacterium]|nr:2-oxoacid:acceptor oxidoreductase subunit alpha [Gemmatimonadota bacterium]
GKGVNDFAFKVATVNGTGSSSANGLLLQALFRMGVPVSGKNVFPSNIQGLPTWYEIRVSRDGYMARSPDFQLVVSMNPQSYARDIEEVTSGGWILYDNTRELDAEFRRDDVTFLGVPLAGMCVEHFQGSRTRILMKNIAYVGALVALLDIDMDVVKGMLHEKFGAKQHLMDANFEAIALGHDYVKEHFDCPLPIRLEAMDATRDSVMITGNAAAALGCVYAGATVGAWYPITPSTSLMDGFTEYCQRFRVDPDTGKNRFCIIQAEDELAAAGMVLGASWMGARAFSPTSGPGISLMSEFIGLAYYAEVPGVFFDVQRTGPSTGMPTRTQQGDIMMCAYASHGDTKHILLFPADPKECFEFAVAAFDLAERFQTPTFVLSDLDIGMNDWMIPKLEWDDSYTPDRGKVLSAEELEGVETFFRYIDVDGDHIASRTLPGVHKKGAYFTRGSGHDKYGRYTEGSDEYVEVMDRLRKKVQSAADHLPAPEVHVSGEGSAFGLISIGGCHWAVLEARDELAARGVDIDYLRVRGFPFNRTVAEFLEHHDKVFVVEQNRDAQLRNLLAIETGCPMGKMASITYYGGQPLSKGHVLEGLAPHLEGAHHRATATAEATS